MKTFLQFIFLYLIGTVVYSKDFAITIESKAPQPIGNCKLPAKIQIPQNAQAAVFFIHGSGALNMDSTLPGGFNTFKDLSEEFLKEQIATIRFDKRSFVKECRKKLNNPKAKHTIFIDDARNVLRTALRNTGIKKLPLFILGHSQGVNFANLITPKQKKIKGQILIAGLGKYAIDTTILRQLRLQTTNISFTKEQKKSLLDLADKGETFFNKIRTGKFKNRDFFMGAYAPFWIDYIKMTQNASDAARRVQVPSLVIQGSKDVNVTQEDFKALVKATSKIKGSHSVYVKNVGHLLIEKNSKRVSDKIITPIIKWIKSR